MSYGPVQVFSGTIASGATTCTSIYLGGKAYSRVYIDVPSLSTSSAFDVYSSLDGTTFLPVFERVNTAPVQYQTLTVASGIGSSSGRAPIDVQGPYLQFRMATTIGNGCTLKVVCVD